MNIESTIRENIDKLKYDYTNIYVSPDIPPKKLDNAIAAYARDVQPGYVLAAMFWRCMTRLSSAAPKMASSFWVTGCISAGTGE